MGVSLMNLDSLTVLLGKAIGAETSSGNSTIKDLLVYEGDLLVILNSTAGTGTDTPTLTVKLKHNDSTSGTFTDVPDGAFSAVTDSTSLQTLTINSNEIKRYMRVHAAISGTNPSFTYSVDIIGQKKYGQIYRLSLSGFLMAFIEDLDIFLSDFGQAVISDGVSYKGLSLIHI